jgi:hypothetical protein
MNEGDGQLHTLSVLEQLREASKGAALDAAIANYRGQRFTLRNGILVIGQHPRT